MIDYNYYTTLNDNDLERLVSHIKNIQNQRLSDFKDLFLAADIEKIEPSLATINKDKLAKVFAEYSQNFTDSDKHIQFYLFLKKHPVTKGFDFNSIENDLTWKYANPTILELIKQELPQTFAQFKEKSFHYSNEDLISYLHKNDMIDFNSILRGKNPSPAMLHYLINNNMFESFEKFPFVSWFPGLSEESFALVRSHFQLDLINYQDIYYKSDENAMKSYMKDVFKYKSTAFLENFIIDEFFVRDCSTMIDKVSDNVKPLDFVLKLYSLIKQEDTSIQEHLIQVLKSQVKKPKNKEMLQKIELNFNLTQDLPSKNIKSSFNKI